MPAPSSKGQEREDTEVREAVERFYSDLARPDAGWAAETVVEADTALVIGTDPTEWWEGYEAICSAWEESRTSHGGTRLTPTRLAIHRYADVAVVVDEPRFSVESEDVDGILRLTLIWLKVPEAGWRLLHLHASAPIANEMLLTD